MNVALRRLAAELMLSAPRNGQLALAFGCACVARVQHLLELEDARDLLRVLEQAVATGLAPGQFAASADRAARLARSHPGSTSIDGSGHSSVTATHALARAMAGRAVDAAEYSAYAMVYSYGRYAVNDASSFEGEFEWQVARLLALSEQLADLQAARFVAAPPVAAAR